MERSLSDRPYRLSESANFTPSLTLSPYLRIAIIMFITLTILELGMMLLGQRMESAPNPLTPIADILPGDPRYIAERLGYSCLFVHHHLPSPKEACSARLATGVFDRAEVAVSRDMVTYETYVVAFTVRRDALRLGDLMMILGRPEINRYSNLTIFRWPGSGITALSLSYNGQFSPSPFLPVQHLAFTNTKLLDCDCN